MSIRLIRKNDGTIAAHQLRDGQIAEITGVVYHGKLVQRHGSNLLCLGEKVEKDWVPCPDYESFRVRVLPNGSELKITDNEYDNEYDNE